MRAIDDLDHFVLRPGESLILRYTVTPSHEQMERMHQLLRRALPDANIIILPPEVEVRAGVIEASAPDHSEDEFAAHMRNVERAYDHAQVIYFYPMDGSESHWCMAHRRLSPHKFDWKANAYSLTNKAMLPPADPQGEQQPDQHSA